MSQHDFLAQAVAKARESTLAGGFPAGSVLVKDSKIISSGISIGNKNYDPTSHSEIAAIRAACTTLATTDLSGAVLYSSLEPCMMCLAAAQWGKLSKIVFACAKNNVSADYYGGNYRTDSLNALFLQPLQIEHDASHQTSSLAIIHEWERQLIADRSI
jgi:tRNA(Arg) A34 adenosine deaminase TadA